MCQTITQEYTATPTKEKRTFPVPSFYKGNYHGMIQYTALLKTGICIVYSTDDSSTTEVRKDLYSHDPLTEQISPEEWYAAYNISDCAIDTAADAVQRLISIPSPVLNEGV